MTGRSTTASGQNRISSLRGYVFRFAPESGHRALQAACLFRAKADLAVPKLNNGSSKGCLQFLNLRRVWPDITLLR
jgi:hypothetical protein